MKPTWQELIAQRWSPAAYAQRQAEQAELERKAQLHQAALKRRRKRKAGGPK